MSKYDYNNTLHILSLTIEDCLDCEMEHLTFSQVDNVHLLLYNLDKSEGASTSTSTSSSLIVTPIGHAVQLLCSREYATAESLRRLPQLKIGRGSVKMTFKLARLGGISLEYDPEPDSDLDYAPSTSKQAEEREERRRQKKQQQRSRRQLIYVVNVERCFDDVQRLDTVMFQVNMGDWREIAIDEFHGIFFVQPPVAAEQVRNIYQDYANDWLKIIQADSSIYSSLKQDGNPFDSFARLMDRNDGGRHGLLKRLATNCLAAKEAARLTERRFLLHIFEQVRFIFEYITINEYTVWFFVPRLNNYVALDQVSVDDFDFRTVRTSIKLTRDESNCFWNRADHSIMDIVLMAFQMALAQVARQSVLVLGQLEKLSQFVCLQYVTASFMNSTQPSDANTLTKWCCPRYLQRVIELSESLGLVVFVEYPDTMTLLQENHKVIKCVQQRNRITGAISWLVSEDLTKKAGEYIQRLKEAIDLN